ncbi:MAG: YdbL family protein [Geminicoccaceae bacterium]
MKLTLRIGAMLLLLCTALPAAAQSLDQAKAAGQVGERIDGYVGVVDANAPGSVRALVDRVNAKREAKYAEIAKERGTPVVAVAQIAGRKLIERAPDGEYVMGANGRWRQK